jgi:hypothetical protein
VQLFGDNQYVTITTSSTTPKGTYQITVVFTETVSGARLRGFCCPFFCFLLCI